MLALRLSKAPSTKTTRECDWNCRTDHLGRGASMTGASQSIIHCQLSSLIDLIWATWLTVDIIIRHLAVFGCKQGAPVCAMPASPSVACESLKAKPVFKNIDKRPAVERSLGYKLIPMFDLSAPDLTTLYLQCMVLPQTQPCRGLLSKFLGLNVAVCSFVR